MFIVLHTCGRIGRKLDAIGGYARNIMHGLHLLKHDSEMLPYIEDPFEAQAYLNSVCEEKYRTIGQMPIVHIQLTHP